MKTIDVFGNVKCTQISSKFVKLESYLHGKA